MDKPGTVVVVGGTCELGKDLARHYVDEGYPVVVTSRDLGRAQATASELGKNCTGLAVDLADPHSIAGALADVEDVQHLALVALHRDENKVREYNIDEAIKLVTLKLVGYTECIHVLAPKMREDASIVIFGGLARNQPYPGSTTITTVNGGVSTLINSLALELSPVRVNAIHPGQVGDTPAWLSKPREVIDNLISRTALGRLVTIEDVTHAAVFLLENRGVTGVNLRVDGGRMMK
ncbi:MAG TPA: SDR family oxidoreductase [Anaerolineales bacterium]|nr:SDR family oxidoreductase [Anaerolineales bacterium]